MTASRARTVHISISGTAGWPGIRINVEYPGYTEIPVDWDPPEFPRSPEFPCYFQARRIGAHVIITAPAGSASGRCRPQRGPPPAGKRWQRLLRLYITGDSLMHDEIRDIAERFGDIDLCLIHLGGTRIAGILLTMDGRQGVQALRTVAPRRAIPVHDDDYRLFKSPLSDFRRAAEQAGLPTEVHYSDAVTATGLAWTAVSRMAAQRCSPALSCSAVLPGTELLGGAPRH